MRAWRYGSLLQDKEMREYAQSQFLSKLAVKNPEKAYQIMDDLKLTGADESNLSIINFAASELMLQAQEQNADAVIKALGYMKSTGIASVRMVTFPADFDFAKVIDAMVKMPDLKSTNSNKIHPSSFPSNFYEEWVKRDSQAALEGYRKSGDIAFNGIDEITVALLEKAPGQNGLSQITGFLNSLTPEQRKEAYGSYGSSALDLLRKQEWPSQAAKEEFANQVIAHNRYSSTSKCSLAWFDSPEKQLQVIFESNAKYGFGTFSKEMLKNTTLTQAQVQDALARGKEQYDANQK